MIGAVLKTIPCPQIREISQDMDCIQQRVSHRLKPTGFIYMEICRGDPWIARKVGIPLNHGRPKGRPYKACPIDGVGLSADTFETTNARGQTAAEAYRVHLYGNL